METDISTYLDKALTILTEYAPKVLGALAVLIIGLWIIGFAVKAFRKLIERRHVDESLQPFLTTMVAFLLKALLFISVAGMLGIATTSFVAILGAMGLAVGLALQGSLANFAGGVLILLFKPFKVGDLIEAQGALGFVKEISVFVTKLETFQNKTEIIPNGPLAGGNVTNFSTKGNVRCDIPFAIRYDGDIDKAQAIVLDLLKNSPLVLQDPAPSVYVTELGENNVQFLALPYSTVENYWDVFWGLRGDIKNALGAAGYQAPYPQRVVTMQNA
ncbi:MAG: mechanosensitive ion channel family protein [Flavobacteriales bacterium]